MEYWNNILCCEAKWLMDSGVMSRENYKKLSLREDIRVVRRGCRNTPALVDYESLPERFRQEVRKRVKDPYSAVRLNILETRIEANPEASDYYERYETPSGKHLPAARRREYYATVVVLEAIDRLMAWRRGKLKATGGKVKRQWEEMARLAQELDAQRWPHNLPLNARSLERKFKQYKEEGYESIIHRNYRSGSTNAAKVATEEQENWMIFFLSDPRNFDDEQVCRYYNAVARSEGWSTIGAGTVNRLRHSLKDLICARRHGARVFHNTRTMQTKRRAPEHPLQFWTLDGWTAELAYKKDGSGGKVGRLTLEVVLDTCTKYPIGYAIGTGESGELIRSALKEAARETERLFGHKYRTEQLQMDQFAKSAMMSVYEVAGVRVTPAAVGNAKAKIIEPWFKYFNKKYCQQKMNWTGFGVTSSKGLQPNSDFLNKYKSRFPTLDELVSELSGMIERERAELRAEYVSRWESMTDESRERLRMSEAQYLKTYGVRGKDRNLMTGQGVTLRIGGRRQTFDCFDVAMREHGDVRWTVWYDPDDLSRALATNDDETLQYELEEKYVQPMALSERSAGDAEQLERVRAYNKLHDSRIAERMGSVGVTVERMASRMADAGDVGELELLQKFLLTDSRGQHKNRLTEARHRSENRLDMGTTDLSEEAVNDDPTGDY